MQRLAVVALLLILLAPLISRWQQMHIVLADDSGLCHGEEAVHAHHPSNNPSIDRHLGNDHHNDHGIACDYCVLVARLLPLLVCLWLFFILRPVSTPNSRLARAAPQAAYWPAPNPRGPPLYS